MLHGPFIAAGPGGWNMDPKAFSPPPAKDGGSRFPAQVRVESTSPAFCIPEATFKPSIQAAYFSPKEFHFELTHGEAAELAQLLRRAAAEEATHQKGSAPAHHHVSSNGPQSTAPHQSNTSQTSCPPQEARRSGDQSELGGKGKATAAVPEEGVDGAMPETSKVAGAEQRKLERAARRAARAAAKSGGAAHVPLQHACQEAKSSSGASGLTTTAAVAAAPHVIDLDAPDPGTMVPCDAQLLGGPHAAAAAASGRGKSSVPEDLASHTSLRSKLDAIFAEAAQPAPSLPSPYPPLPVGSSLPAPGPVALPSVGKESRPVAQVNIPRCCRSSPLSTGICRPSQVQVERSHTGAEAVHMHMTCIHQPLKLQEHVFLAECPFWLETSGYTVAMSSGISFKHLAAFQPALTQKFGIFCPLSCSAACFQGNHHAQML